MSPVFIYGQWWGTTMETGGQVVDGCYAMTHPAPTEERTQADFTSSTLSGGGYFDDMVGPDQGYVDAYNNSIQNLQTPGGCGWSVDITNVWTGPVDYQPYYSFTNSVFLDGWSVTAYRDGVPGLPISWPQQ
jgi:hypothetical protein